MKKKIYKIRYKSILLIYIIYKTFEKSVKKKFNFNMKKTFYIKKLQKITNKTVIIYILYLYYIIDS